MEGCYLQIVLTEGSMRASEWKLLFWLTWTALLVVVGAMGEVVREVGRW